MQLHWLDINSYQGTDPVRVLVDRGFDWRRIDHPRYSHLLVDQINSASALVLSAAEPYWQLKTPNQAYTVLAVSTNRTVLGTGLAESLFWCGWDQWGGFETSESWEIDHCVLGGLPRELCAASPGIINFQAMSSDHVDLEFAVRAILQGSVPVPVGSEAVLAWRRSDLPLLNEFDFVSDDLDQWHDAVWQFSETVTRDRAVCEYRVLAETVLSRVLAQCQHRELVDTPQWARNTLRLAKQFQRGRARIIRDLQNVLALEA